jgi:hypothetical protein
MEEEARKIAEAVVTNGDAYPPDLVTRAKRICDDLAFIDFKIEYLRRIVNHEEID